LLYKVDAFLRILLIELEDLESDIELLIEKYGKDHKEEKISNYVFKENIALAYNELFGVEGLYGQVKEFRAEEFKSIDDVALKIDEILDFSCSKKGYIRSICILVRRKIEKVRKYVEGDF